MTRSPLFQVFSSLQTHRLLLGVLALPMVLGSLVVWSLGDRAAQVQQVPAAVVNLDKPVLEKGQQPIAAGRLLAAGLTSPTEKQRESLGWKLTSSSDAVAGLRDGSYYAVLVIPKGFSRTIGDALAGRDPRRARIRVITDAASSALVSRISAQVARVSADRLGERVTGSYLATVFSGTDKLAAKLGKAADGANRLADGTQQLGQGTQRFAGGLGRLSQGADRLAQGGRRLATGTDRLASGSSRLAAGTGRLASGLRTLGRRTDALPRQTDQLADGAVGVARGVEGYSRLLEGWAQACANPLIAAQAARLCLATERAVGVGGTRAKQFRQGARQLADGTRRLAEATPRLTGAIDRAAAGADRLAGGARRLTGGASRLADGSDRLAGGADRLARGAATASDGASQLSTGSARLGAGSRKLAGGLQRGAEQIPQSDPEERQKMADVIAAPVAAQADRLGKVADGRTQLAPGTIAFVLWLGAFATSLVRPALSERLPARPRSASRIAVAGAVPSVMIGALQAALVYAAMVLLGVTVVHPVATALLMLVGAAGFAAVNQAFVAVLGRRRGWLLSIAFAGVQAVSLGGVIPLDTAPWPMRVLNAVLPMTAAADGLVATILDGPESVAAAVAVLVAWTALAIAALVAAARRAQMVDLDQLREQADARDAARVG